MRKDHLCYSFHILKNIYIPYGPILSLNKFSFIKILTRITPPYWGQVKISMIKKAEKVVRKPKRQKSPNNSNARGYA